MLATLQAMEGAVQLWIGDTLNIGEAAYGEKYAQAVDPIQANTWKQYAWVARSIEKSTRVDILASISAFGVYHSFSPRESDSVLQPSRRWVLARVARPRRVRVLPTDRWLDEFEERIGNMASVIEAMGGDAVEFEKAMRVVDYRRGLLLGRCFRTSLRVVTPLL